MGSRGSRVASAASDRSGTRGSFQRGTCPVCRRGNIALRSTTGKIMPHGRSAASPGGCAGNGQAPYREPRRQAAGELPVAPIRPAPPAHDEPAEPDLDIEVLIERRDEPQVRVRSARPQPDDAA